MVSAFFVSVTWAEPGSYCTLQGKAETVRWERIVDGDTIWLKDGRKVRFASINTPEVAHEDKPGEPFGEEAKAELTSLLKHQPQLKLQLAGRGEDFHGRTLAYLFLPNGQSVGAHLLSKGLAYQIFNEVDTRYTQCLKSAEQAARQAGEGLWRRNPVRDIRADRLSSGFQVLQGTVSVISQPKKSRFVWIEMDGPVVLRVPKEGLNKSWLQKLPGKRVEFRGWLVDRHKSREKQKQGGRAFKRWMLGIYHPEAVQFL